MTSLGGWWFDVVSVRDVKGNVLRVSKVTEGDLVSPNLIRAVSRSWHVIRVVNRTIRPDLQSSLLGRLHVL